VGVQAANHSGRTALQLWLALLLFDSHADWNIQMFFRRYMCISMLVSTIASAVAIFAQTSSAVSPDTSTVVVLGTVHNPTMHYDLQVLTNILRRMKPDLILVELDSSFFGPSMALKPEYAAISLENRAVSAYLESNPVPIRPYDIEGRNQIYAQHDYFKLQRDLSSALNAAEAANLLDGNARFLFDAIRRFDKIGAGFGSERPEVINSTACDVAMESKQYYAGEGMVHIVSSVQSLGQFVGFCKFRRDFWADRNEAMLKNILSLTKLLRARTIVVLCGYEHRYYLRNGLTKQAESQAIRLKEYWDF
jgi:hypothetical protein